MKVKVCDALCGAGKTSAAINMMNERTDAKFIFVTQYLTETERIKEACPTRNFVLPEADISKGETKLGDTHRLLRDGRNIATTHSLFTSFTNETKQLLKDGGYILILDEVVDIFLLADLRQNDVDILVRSDSIHEENGIVEWTNAAYQEGEGGKFYEEMMRAKSKNLLRYDGNYFCWAISPELFTCFEEVYVLTYLFYAQTLRCFFELHGIQYDLVGTKKEDETYRFCPVCEMDRRRELRDKIHILDHKKLNTIGGRRSALSATWYDKAVKDARNGGDALSLMRRNVSNLVKNIWGAPASKVMWTTFKAGKINVMAKGYMNSFVTYNKRASNEYSGRTHLAYCVNNFPRPWEVRYFRENGVEVDGDMYALSILIQWIFRSAIRNGEEIWVYIPSARMRSLFIQWMDNLADGRDLEPVSYKTPRKNYYQEKKKSKKNKGKEE